MKKKQANEPIYPLLISEDKEGFENSTERFLKIITQSISGINGIKEKYDSMMLEDAFDDTLWQLLCRGSNILNDKWLKRCETLKQRAKENGTTVDPILNRLHPAIADISNRIITLRIHLSNIQNSSKAKLSIEDIIDVDTEPKLSILASDRHFRAYGVCVNNVHEAAIKASLDRFAVAYNEFVYLLNSVGYGPHVSSIVNNSYLHNFFNEDEGFNLVTNPTAWGFLANLSK